MFDQCVAPSGIINYQNRIAVKTQIKILRFASYPPEKSIHHTTDKKERKNTVLFPFNSQIIRGLIIEYREGEDGVNQSSPLSNVNRRGTKRRHGFVARDATGQGPKITRIHAW